MVREAPIDTINFYARLEMRLKDLESGTKHHDTRLNAHAENIAELTGWLVALQERVSKLERLLERED